MLSDTHPYFQDLSPKLMKGMLSLELIDKSSTTHWKSEESSCFHHIQTPHKDSVTDILLWVECYSILVESVMDAGEYIALVSAETPS